MKIALFDDLHFESNGKFDIELPEADVCVLAGDICVAALLSPHRTDADARKHKKACDHMFSMFSEKYPIVLYVMGNHEHYHGVFDNTPIILREFLRKWNNIILLDKETYDINDVRFFGATFWTSCNNGNPITNLVLRAYMKDFTVIKRNDNSKWTPFASYLEWQTSVEQLQKEIYKARADNISKMVVISHHCPSRNSIDERYAHETQGNFAYYSDLDELVDTRPIVAWLHGHVHVAMDYFIGDTRIVCNPRGYPFEIRHQSTGFNNRKIIKV